MAAAGFQWPVPFVGRETELARIRDAVRELDAGRQVIVEVIGDPGSGKSRLIDEAVRRIDRPGTTVCVGTAARAEREIPFHVFLHALGDEVAAHLVSRHQLWAAVAREGGSGRLTVARYQLYGAWRRALAARVGPGLVLVLDDLHWADPTSMELIEHLVRYPVPGPLMLVLASRPDADTCSRTVRCTGDQLVWKCRITLDPTPSGGPDPLVALTDREREVARLTVTGATSRYVARQLQVSPRTVDAHLTRIYRKLGITSRTALAGLLNHHGMGWTDGRRHGSV